MHGGRPGAHSTRNAQYGPQLTITFPDYNFGTAKRAAFYISGFVLPTGDFLFVNIQAGGAFSLSCALETDAGVAVPDFFPRPPDRERQLMTPVRP